MKILAIRGHNLASLGHFAVELAQAPLATAGLFAITGPTGAGKSTLLDALCLALFDRVPRLSNATKVKVGRAGDDDSLRVGSDDVRSILRRGSSEGRAEVDFLGVDGQRYRAIWTVRRARGKAAGKLQTQEMSLLSLPDEVPMGRNRSEILPTIQERLGLSFDQFRRSALLAQNEFAAFLRANAKERADLLERITGTELYGELSRRAHQRERQAQEALRTLQRDHQALAPLPKDIRAAREAELADREATVQTAEAALRAAEQERDWYQTLDELQQRESEARDALDAAQQALTEARPRRDYLAAVQSAQPLRASQHARDQAREALHGASDAVAQAKTAQQAAETAVQQAETQLTATRGNLAAATQDRQGASEALQQARTLDTQIQSAQQQESQLAAEHTRAQQTHDVCQQALQTLQRQEQQAQEQLSRAEAWLQQHQHLQALAAHWHHWQATCERLTRSSTQLASNKAERRTLQEAQRKLRQQQQSLETKLATAQQDLQQAEATRTEAETQEQQHATEDLTRRREVLERIRQQRQEQQQQYQEYQTLLSQQQAQQTQQTEQTARLGVLETRLAELPAQLDTQRASLAEAERSLALAETARRLEVQTLRQGLRPGEPCPVCGSLEHPWASTSPLAALADEQATRVAELRGSVENLSREESALGVELSTLQQGQQQLQTSLQALNQQLEASQQRWQQAGVSLDTAGEWLATEQQRLHTELEALSQAETHAHRAREAAQQARQALDKARQYRDKLQQQQTALSTELQPLSQQLQTLEIQASQYQESVDQASQALAEPLKNLPDLLALRDRDPAALEAACAAELSHWEAQQQHREQAVTERHKLAPQLAAAQRDLDHATTELTRVSTQRTTAQAQQQQLAAQRATLFEGRAAATVEAELDAALGRASEALEAARKAREVAAQQHQQASLALAAAQERQQLLTQESSTREAAFTQQLAEQGWDEATLASLLHHGTDWVSAEEVALQALHTTLEQAKVRVDERHRRLQEHHTSTPPSRDLPTLTSALPDLRTAVDAARQQAAQVRAELYNDDTRRQQSAELLTKLAEREREAILWGRVDELIGSADGSKFRRFAQSLTLENLLGHANLHLQDLTRRYRLERAPGSDLELQVIDREMGDEVRSVHSLSGGESFLTSLALALGLASLAADRTPVESLFIDEGFGSLDPETLDTALASLDALQAQGRQVGVISHVPALTERIGVQIRVLPRGGGRSELRLDG